MQGTRERAQTALVVFLLHCEKTRDWLAMGMEKATGERYHTVVKTMPDEGTNHPLHLILFKMPFLTCTTIACEVSNASSGLGQKAEKAAVTSLTVVISNL